VGRSVNLRSAKLGMDTCQKVDEVSKVPCVRGSDGGNNDELNSLRLGSAEEVIAVLHCSEGW
jgi:hypothetical protein